MTSPMGVAEDGWKQLLLETINDIEALPNPPNPTVFKWTLPEKEGWTIALGFKKNEVAE